MERQPRPMTPLHISQSFQRRLASYAAAAGAASIGALALATLAEAKVVYTPKNVQIPVNFGIVGYGLDLNNDGIADFNLGNELSDSMGGQVAAPAVRGNRVLGAGRYASALASGANIGPAGPFAHRADGTLMARWAYFSSVFSTRGPWKSSKDRYLGFKFLVNGEYHFGWARLSIHIKTMTLTGYAYETVANTPITAGEETESRNAAKINPADPDVVAADASLGHLAQGLTGLVAWRRRGA